MTFHYGKLKLSAAESRDKLLSAMERNVSRRDARVALETVGAMRELALTRGLPPRWLGGAISAILGVVTVLSASGAEPILVVATFLTIWPLIYIGRKTLKVMARRSSYGFSFRLLVVQLAFVFLIVTLIESGKRWRADYAWAPFAAGIMVTVAFYVLFEYKRATFVSSITVENRA